MNAVLTIVRYPKRFAVFGFLSMVVFHIFLRRNKDIAFYKLMGSGKNGTFDITPDLQQWALLVVCKNDISSPVSNEALFGKAIANWWKKFRCHILTMALQPIEGHGKWDKKECFGKLPKTSEHEGLTAVLTRATLRIGKAKLFWQNVSAAAIAVADAPGFITSFGIGEVPWIKQATFSVWKSKKDMKAYAYKMQQHRQVIQKTRTENWYREEMFVRFKIVWTSGDLNGKNELMNYLELR